MDFPALLDRMSATLAARDGHGFTALFTPDAVYEDYFFGPHCGHDEITAMFDRFFEGGEAFCWQFLEPLHAEDLAYAPTGSATARRNRTAKAGWSPSTACPGSGWPPTG